MELTFMLNHKGEKMTNLTLSHREHISTILRNNRLVIAAELLIVTIIQIFDAWGLQAIFVLFPFGWLSFWLQKSGWRDVGLRRPASWPRTIGIGMAAGVVNALFALWLIAPLVTWLGGGKEDLSQYESLPGNIPVLIVWILIGWIIGGFMEEMFYRGYLLNRIAGFFGQNQAGWAVGLLASSAFFALGHLYLGVSGIVQTFFEACFWALLYMVGRRNLWLTIIGHGTINTLAFILMYFGLYPGIV
jgi:membrane protease YdiL (CAAX protease family)